MEVRLEMGSGAHKNEGFPHLLFKSFLRRKGAGKVRLFSIRCLTMCVSGGDLRKKQHVLL